MARHILLCSALMSFVGGISESAYGRGGIPIPVVWGHGEKLTDLGELPPDVSRGVAEELGRPATVAFLHQYVHIFWMDLWTWNGRHVLRSDDMYWEPDAPQWERMIGGDPSTKYGKPILYRIPILLGLFVVAAAGCGVWSVVFKTEKQKLEILFKDKRYQRAIHTLFDTGDNEQTARLVTTLDEQRFFLATNELIGEGVAAHSAETNLRKMANTILSKTNSEIDEALEVASQLDKQGRWDKSAEIYSQLSSSLSRNDKRLTYIQKCLDSIGDKPAAIATEQSSKPELPTAPGLSS